MMNLILSVLAIGAIAFLGILLFPRSAIAAKQSTIMSMPDDIKSTTPFELNFKEAADKYGVPWQLLSAIAFVESSYNHQAVNALDNESLGLMQILCRPDGQGGCSNRFPAIPEFTSMKRQDFFNPDHNISIGAQILRWNMDNYGLPAAIAIYNAFDQRFRPRNGPFKNQNYVNRVLARAKELNYEI